MKVKIEMTVEIDEKEWAATFGVPNIPGLTRAGCIRAAVQEDAEAHVEAAFRKMGMLK